VLDAADAELRGGRRECRLRALDALVVDRAGRNRLHGMRAHRMKAEANAAVGLDRLELAANSVVPRVVHAEDLRAGRQLQAGAPPRIGDDLALHLELVRVIGVLPLAAAAPSQESWM